MKKIFLAAIVVVLFSTCKETPEPFKPVCANVTLEKIDSDFWTYCDVVNNTYPIKCNNGKDTLSWKILKHFDDVKATILYDGPNSYCVLLDVGFEGVRINGQKEVFSILAALNLPECYKKDKLKIKISGDLRPFFSLSEANCGDPFELTKIEEIP